ncbi:MAG: Na+/solute symporter [Peptococcaceae bacterium]|jgi:SSS family solute:Na+ symporter|nr:Na+/solute symporter [Peptococcaceae bacterium]
MLTPVHIISMVLTLIIVTVVGVYSIRQVKTSADFAVGGRSMGVSLVAGTIMGTVVGGASTIGTAQLAFKVGFSAWWFTLGAGIACLLLGVLAKPLRESGASTAPQFLVKAYGERAGPAASIFSSLGIFLNIIGQILSAVALITSMFQVPPLLAAFIAVVLVISYVIFGGVWGTGMVGVVKLILLYISLAVAGILSYQMIGGLPGLTAKFPAFPWFSLFGRGFNTDAAAGFSLVVGVLSTQTYLQAMFSGRDVPTSRRGALVSAFLIPPIGLASIMVGLYMRSHFPGIDPREALPLFILQFLNPWVGGMVLATLLLSVVGTGAGLTLGISTMLSQDIYKKIINPKATDSGVLAVTRVIIIVVTLATLVFVGGNLNSLILKWSFLSMGLRGATICFPLLAAIFLTNKIAAWAGRWAIIAGPSAVLLWTLLGGALDPLYVGMACSLFLLVIGYFSRKAFS